MEVYDSIRTVLAVREFKNIPVPDDSIRKILESARLIASSRNGQPWSFIVIQSHDSLIELGSIVRSGPYTAQSAFAIAVAIEKESPYGLSDASRAIQAMVLTAWADGIGSNWAGWVGMNAVADYLGVPDTHDVIAVIPFGYPLKSKAKGIKRRKEFYEIVHSERFGQPFN